MKIVLDFDDTIFNTYRLMQEFLAVFTGLSFQEKQFWNAYAKCKDEVGCFDKEILINLLCELKPFDKRRIDTKIDSIIKKSNNFIYPDFFDFVSDFKKENLILLSFGITDFQKIKIENSGIIPYFYEIIITSRDKTDDIKEIQKKYKEKIFFIDDKAEQIDRIKGKFSKIVTMKMERSQGGHMNTRSKLADYVVKNLYEAENIIKL